MNKEEKKALVTDMRECLQKAQATFIVDYQGLDVESINKVRRDLKKTGTEFRVVKNRRAKLASQDTQTAPLEDQFVGPCALAIAYDEIISPAKMLVDLTKEYKHLSLKAAQTSGKPMDADGIRRLAELPSREELLAQVLSAMQASPASLVRVLNGVITSFLNALKAIEQQKAEQRG